MVNCEGQKRLFAALKTCIAHKKYVIILGFDKTFQSFEGKLNLAIVKNELYRRKI